MRFIALLVLAVAPLFSQAAAAQDIPGRVGRVSYIDGSVSIYHDPDIGWEGAFVNSPITSENSLWTDPRSRAEMRVSAVAVRLDEATQLDLSRLDDEEMDASIVRGSIAVRIRHNEYGSRFVFDTPEARFTISREGRYRIDVDADAQETRLAVFAGEASMETSEGVRRIPAGRMVAISDGDYRFDRAYLTDFDGWSQARDRHWVERQSVRYVSTFMTGYEELDPYGQWIQDPQYGVLWAPTQVAADWVPYRYGRWSYVRPWGWTWIDDQPWGYAPFHYGRWVHVRERWCWYPGRREARPVWAPALVAWVGGSNWSVGVSSGAPVMGWYPLAPHERYQPWYQANERYVTRVNNIVVNNVTINNYQRAAQEVNRTLAVTAVPRENLIERKPVQQSMVRVTQDFARSAPVAQPQAVMPNHNEIQRMRASIARTAPASVASPAAAPSMPSATAPTRAQGAQPGQGGNAPIARQRPGQPGAPSAPGTPLPTTAPQAAPGGPVGPLARPSFARPQNTPPPAPTPAAANGQPAQRAQPAQPARPAQPQQGQPAQPAVPAQPAQPAAGNPLSRGNGGRERADQVHERNQERQDARAVPDQQRQLQQQQQQQQQQQEQQRRAAEAQQRQQQQQQQQQQQEAQRQQQEAQRQQEQQRRAAETQRQQDAQRQQQEAQRQQEQQRRAAEAQQRQQQQQQQQQQEQQRRAAEAQRQQDAQRQQQEAQRQQQEQRRAAEAQQRRAQEAQRQQQEAAQRQAQEAQRQQQEAQRRAAEAQRAQQPQAPRPAPQPAPQPVPQAAPQAQPPQAQPPQAGPGNPASRGEERRARPHPDKPDEEEKGKGR